MRFFLFCFFFFWGGGGGGGGERRGKRGVKNPIFMRNMNFVLSKERLKKDRWQERDEVHPSLLENREEKKNDDDNRR